MKRELFCFVIVSLLIILSAAKPQTIAQSISDTIRKSDPAWKPINLAHHSAKVFCIMYEDMFRTLGLKIKPFDRNRVAIQLGTRGHSAEDLEAMVQQFDRLKQPVQLLVNEQGQIGIASRDATTVQKFAVESLDELFIGNETVNIQADSRVKAAELTSILSKLKELKIAKASVTRAAPSAWRPPGPNPAPAGPSSPSGAPQPGPVSPLAPTSPNAAPRPHQPSQPEIPELRHRQAPGVTPGIIPPPTTPARPQIPAPTKSADKQRLRREVEAAFEARQQSQRAKLQHLRQRLSTIEDSIAARQRNKEEIIRHRIAELLDPNLRWENEPGVGKPVLRDQRHSMQTPWDENKSTNLVHPESKPLQTSGWLGVIRNTSDLQQQLVDHKEAVSAFESILKHNPDHGDIGGVTQRLRRARRDLALATQEFETQYELLKVEQRNAKAVLERAQQRLERLKSLDGAISGAVLNQATQDYDDARRQADRINVLVNLYQRTASTATQEPSDLGGPARLRESLSSGTSIALLRAELDAATAKYKRLARAASRRERDDLRMELDVMQAKLADAENDHKNKTKMLKFDTDEAAANLQLAQAKYDRAQEANRKVAGTINADELSVLAADVEKAEIALKRARTLLSAHTEVQEEPSESADK